MLFGRKKDKGKQKAGSLTRIGSPTAVSHVVHVDQDYNWSGPEAAKQFAIKEKLGEGSFGVVYRAEHRESHTPLAIKVIPLDQASGSGEAAGRDELAEVMKEIEILKRCRSPNIVSLFGCFRNGADFWILMDYAELGSVRDLLDALEAPLRERQIAAILAGSIAGLSFLHTEKSIIHRDIKAANILLDAKGAVKLADFGVSKQVLDAYKMTSATVGTPLWMAPEVITKQNYSFSVDVWSLGVTAIEMAEQFPPYADVSPIRAMLLINRNPPPVLKSPRSWSPEFVSFVTLCLNKAPAKRPTAQDLMRHPLITGAPDGPEGLKDLIAFGVKLRKRKTQLAKAVEQEIAAVEAGAVPPALPETAPSAIAGTQATAGTCIVHGTLSAATTGGSGGPASRPRGSVLLSPPPTAMGSGPSGAASVSSSVVFHTVPSGEAPSDAPAPPPSPRPAAKPTIGSFSRTKSLRSIFAAAFPATPRDAAAGPSPLFTATRAVTRGLEAANVQTRDMLFMAIGAGLWQVLLLILRFLG